MNVSCPECRSVFRLDPAKITSVSMRARCSVCGGLIPVGAAISWGDELQAVAASVPATQGRVNTPVATRPAPPRAKTPAASSSPSWPPRVPRAEPPPAAAPRASAPPPSAAAPRTPVAPSPVPRTPVAPSAAPPPNQQAAPPRHRTPPFSPRFTPQVPKEPSPGQAGSGSRGEPQEPLRTPRPEAAAPIDATFGAPLTPPSRTSIPEPPQPKPATPPTFTASGNVSAAFSTPSTPASASASVQRKPINPFLANDPNQRARRLARALVSDMVAYHPAKREEGLHGGTLKQLFRDEIKKSYEEYVEQVGREFAESTMHFQEALNDVLAGGRKVF